MTVIDTSVLARLLDPAGPDGAAARERLTTLTDPVICDQVLYEIWSMSTRPKERNGFGFSPIDADRALSVCLRLARRLPDPPTLFDRWRSLCLTYDVRGKPSHDARIAAFAIEIGADDLLTLNPSDFRRFPIPLL